MSDPDPGSTGVAALARVALKTPVSSANAANETSATAKTALRLFMLIPFI